MGRQQIASGVHLIVLLLYIFGRVCVYTISDSWMQLHNLVLLLQNWGSLAGFKAFIYMNLALGGTSLRLDALQVQ